MDISQWTSMVQTHINEIKVDLKHLETVDSNRLHTEVGWRYSGHSNKLCNVRYYYDFYKLQGNKILLYEYEELFKKLKEIYDKAPVEDNKNDGSDNRNEVKYCCECKKTITSQYFQKDGKKFCSQYCLDEYYVCDNCKQKVKEITGKYYDSFSGKRGAKGLVCEICYRGACSECYQPNPENYYYHRGKLDDKKFCSKSCFINHYKKEVIQEKKLQDHEKALAELEKLSKERKSMKDNPQKEPNDYVDKQKDNTNSDEVWHRERERERERTRAQQTHLRTQIQQLEAKPTRTSQEEVELTRKREELKKIEQKLKDLEQQKKGQEQQPEKDKNSGLKIGIGIGVVTILGCLVVVTVRSKKNKSKKH